MTQVRASGRPTRRAARRAVERFLGLPPRAVEFHLIPDGESGWAFWLAADDTTSYVHSDLRIEWYGSWRCPKCGCDEMWEDNLTYGCVRCDWVKIVAVQS